MRGQNLGSLIAAVFGLIYVLVNSGQLPTVAAVPLRVLAALAFFGVLVLIRRSRPVPDPGSGTQAEPGGPVFGAKYWLIVAIEVAALAAGLAGLNGPLDAPQAGVAWVSVVVGLHFFPLGALFREPFFYWLAAAITVCGVAGLVMAAIGAAEAPIAVVSGVVPGALLLAAGLWGARRNPELQPSERPA